MISATTAAQVTTIASTSSTRSQPETARPCRSTAMVNATAKQMTVVKAIRRPVGQRCSMSLRLPEAARDHETLDLVRALIDLGDLGVAHVALDRILAHVAVAAEHLYGLDGDVHRGVGGEQLGHRGVLAAVGLVAVDLGARPVEQLARGGRPRLHVGELELHALELGDRLPELPALVGVGDRVVDRALGDPPRLRGDAEPRVVERAERDVHALVDLADQVRGGDADVVEDRLARRRALDPELVLELADAEAGTV